MGNQIARRKRGSSLSVIACTQKRLIMFLSINRNARIRIRNSHLIIISGSYRIPHVPSYRSALSVVVERTPCVSVNISYFADRPSSPLLTTMSARLSLDGGHVRGNFEIENVRGLDALNIGPGEVRMRM